MSKQNTDFHIPEIKNFGSAKLGERGQIVIPKKIRESMKMKPGDDLIVFTKADKVISFIKQENFDIIIKEMSGLLNSLKKSNGRSAKQE